MALRGTLVGDGKLFFSKYLYPSEELIAKVSLKTGFSSSRV